MISQKEDKSLPLGKLHTEVYASVVAYIVG